MASGPLWHWAGVWGLPSRPIDHVSKPLSSVFYALIYFIRPTVPKEYIPVLPPIQGTIYKRTKMPIWSLPFREANALCGQKYYQKFLRLWYYAREDQKIWYISDLLRATPFLMPLSVSVGVAIRILTEGGFFDSYIVLPPLVCNNASVTLN